ncbi:MAG: hypothetical protein IPL90_13070 [Holophagales bacterium]|nr:hypothetical protein [Holophagales bacterium]
MKSKPSALAFATAALLIIPAGCGRPAETSRPAEAPPAAVAPAAETAAAPATGSAVTPAAVQSGVPDALPASLIDAHSANSFAVDLYMKWVPPNVFSGPVASEEEKANARKALPLVVAAYDKAIGFYANNESFYYGRAAALEVMYTDTKDEALKTRALADLDKALSISPKHSPSLALKARLSK